jgi:hypothetical protein
MRSNALVKCIIGPLGSGKSMAGQFELFRRMCQQDPDEKGIRPTRFVIVRNTAAQLRETVLPDAKQYFGDYFTYKVSTGTMEFRFDLGDGTKVQSDWLMMPLERPEDQRKLLSLNITAAMIEECREVPYDVVAAVMGRIGRYPSMSRVPPTWQALVMVSNPWSISSQYHENFIINKPEDWDFFHQPSGLDPDAENRQFLPAGYYERLMDGNSDEWIRVHVMSEFGDDQFGQAVYKAAFKNDDHIVDQLHPNPMLPLVLGMDFGRTPCAVITQMDPRGRMLALNEVTSENMGLHKFLNEKLVPFLGEHYSNYRIFVMGDPAGVAKGQYTEDSAFSVLKEAGLEALPAPTNDPERRIRAVEKRLVHSVGDSAGFLVSRTGCPMLTEGFIRGYRYKKKRDGELTPYPDKNEFSHIHDALQYAALGHQGNFIGKRILRTQERPAVRMPRISKKAWT